MIGLLQRVNSARVEVAGLTIGAIDRGLLVLVGVQRGDNASRAERLVERLISYRVFPDDAGRMSLSLRDIVGGLLLVPQFTLAADTRKGTRASFKLAASPDLGAILFDHLVAQARTQHPLVETGQFGADMQVSLVNDGPVTFWLET
jgi:D-aminoacyl-tRNA deacylase